MADLYVLYTFSGGAMNGTGRTVIRFERPSGRELTWDELRVAEAIALDSCRIDQPNVEKLFFTDWRWLSAPSPVQREGQ